jgi:predicted  nucleic acid-binding Zn-ribbon protein
MTASKERYHIKSACPQCGCSYAQVLSPEEIKEKYGDMPNVELECGECMLKFEKAMAEACPEWDAECKLKE